MTDINSDKSQSRNIVLKNAMTVGLIGAAISISLSIPSQILRIESLNFLSLFRAFVIIGTLYYSIKNIKEKFQNGYMTYGSAVRIGVLTSFFFGVVMSLYIFLLFSYFRPDLWAQQIEVYKALMGEFGMSKTEIQASHESAKQLLQPINSLISFSFAYTVIGFLISLVLGLILRKNGDSLQNVPRKETEDQSSN